MLVRVEWRDIEPTPGQYRWGLLDEQLALAQRYKKKVALAVLNGPAAPEWLNADPLLGVPFRYQFRGRAAALPVPWNSTYLSAWKRFIQALGHRYNGHPTIELVHVTHSTFNGLEMQLPSSPADRQAWQNLGYSKEKLIASWLSVIGAFAEAFPSVQIDVEVHPVTVAAKDNPNYVAAEVVSQGKKRWGKRLGVFAGWWSQDNAMRVYPEMFSLIRRASSQRYFTAIQMVASVDRTPERIGGGMPAAVDLALGSGVNYMEVWENDLLAQNQHAYWQGIANRIERVNAQ